MATLVRVKTPTEPLQLDDEQGEPITLPNGWTVRGYRAADGTYYEQGIRGKEVRWFRLD